MREPSSDSPNGFTFMIRVCAIVASFVIAFICFRLPIPTAVKVALLLAAFFLVRWLFSIPRKIEGDHHLEAGRQFERSGNTDAAIHHYELAVNKLPADSTAKLRLLSAYNGALQVDKAKGFIAKLNGQSFREDQVEELESIISQYRKVKLSRNGSRFRVILQD